VTCRLIEVSASDLQPLYRRVHRLRKATASFITSVLCPYGITPPHWTDFHKTWYLGIFRKLPRKFTFHWNPTRITGTLHEDEYTFLIISLSFLLRMRNVVVVEKIKTHFVFNNFFENSAVYEIMWKNVELGRPQMIVWRVLIACWISRLTRTHSYFHRNSVCTNVSRCYVIRTLSCLFFQEVVASRCKQNFFTYAVIFVAFQCSTVVPLGW